MARRTGLREFQLSVAERIRTAASRAALSSKLGVQVGGENWFVALNQVAHLRRVVSNSLRLRRFSAHQAAAQPLLVQQVAA